MLSEILAPSLWVVTGAPNRWEESEGCVTVLPEWLEASCWTEGDNGVFELVTQAGNPHRGVIFCLFEG